MAFDRLRSLPMFWKLLLPFLALMIVVGSAGTLLVVRDLAGDAQAALDQELARRSADARAALHDRELYLLEALNFASNIQGMPEALRDRDRGSSARLLRSVLALKTDLDLLVVTDARGRQVAGFVSGTGQTPRRRSAQDSSELALARRALLADGGKRTAGLIVDEGRSVLAIAGPVCITAKSCDADGVAIAGVTVGELARNVSRVLTTGGTEAGVVFVDADGRVLAGESMGVDAQPAEEGARRTYRTPSGEVVTLGVPLEVGGENLGTLAITVPKGPAFGAVRSAGIKLAILVLIAMLGVVGVGALMSRFILGQMRKLVAMSRALGEGQLDARVLAMNDDEMGEVARALNQMAEQLQASYETLESRVVQRTEEVRRLLDERTQFFASMSHEFRTPLAVILSESDLILDPDRPFTVRHARETVKTVRASGEQLLRVINDILDLAQADAGRIELELEPTRLAQVFEDLRPTMDGLARSGGSTLSVDIPSDLAPVMADQDRLREVILNLVDNAVKYTPPEGTISISAASRNGSVEVSVTDTGVGIPKEVGDRIFEPFFRVKGIRPARGQASSGLGLALAKRFVEAQGGRMMFVSAPGQGSTFTFTVSVAGQARKKRRRVEERALA